MLYSIDDLLIESKLQLHLQKRTESATDQRPLQDATVDVTLYGAGHHLVRSNPAKTLAMPGGCIIELVAPGSVVVREQEKGALEESQHILEPAVLAILLRSLGYLVFNGTAVARPDGMASLIIGHSGAGKSTLGVAACGGKSLLSDELIILRRMADRFQVIAGSRYVKLWDDALQRVSIGSVEGVAVRQGLGKKKIEIGLPACESSCVRQIFFLDALSRSTFSSNKIRHLDALKKLIWAESKWRVGDRSQNQPTVVFELIELLKQSEITEVSWSRRFPSFRDVVKRFQEILL